MPPTQCCFGPDTQTPLEGGYTAKKQYAVMFGIASPQIQPQLCFSGSPCECEEFLSHHLTFASFMKRGRQDSPIRTGGQAVEHINKKANMAAADTHYDLIVIGYVSADYQSRHHISCFFQKCCAHAN